MISISRFPYPQYHTSEDNTGIISRTRLEETLELLKKMIGVFENDRMIRRNFEGLVALSNPKYDLYVERPEPNIRKRITELDLKLGQLQDLLPRYFDGRLTIFQIADEFDIPFDTLREWIGRFQEKNLVELSHPGSFDRYGSTTFSRRTPSRMWGY